MFTRFFSPVRFNLHSSVKRNFCTCFTIKRHGVETSFMSPHSIHDAIKMAKAISSRSKFLEGILNHYNEKGILNEIQEKWIRFFVWQEEQGNENCLYDQAGRKKITVNTKKGAITFTTELSLREAASICRLKQQQNEFSKSLVISFDEDRLSIRQKPWMYKIAQDEIEKYGTQPKNIYTITSDGWREEFECDWSLARAYEELKSDTKTKSEFELTLLDSYEKKGGEMSAGEESWLFRLALDATDSLPIPLSKTLIKDENGGRTFSVKRNGVNEEFTCDWPLEKAYHILKNDEGSQSDFVKSLIESYEKYGSKISESREAWLLKLAMEVSAQQDNSTADEQTEVQKTSPKVSSYDDSETSRLKKWEVFKQGNRVTFETELSVMEAVQLIRKDRRKGSTFRDELVEKYVVGAHLSEKQEAWIMFFGNQLEKKHGGYHASHLQNNNQNEQTPYLVAG